MTTLRFADGTPASADRATTMELLSIVSAVAEPDTFARLLKDAAFPEIEAYPHTGAFGRAYHPAIHGDHDCSFAVLSGWEPVLVCLCSVVDGTLGFYSMPIRVIARERLAEADNRAAVARAFLHLDEIAKTHGAREAIVHESMATSPIADECRAREGKSSVVPVAQVDLAAGHAAWRAALRKSSRSLINWGRRNLAVSLVNRDTPDRALFDRYQEFHAEVAGRVTRAQASWDAMYQWISQGGGELVLGSLDGKLVAGSLFVDGTQTCIYASGVYDRSLFDKPLAHYPLWLGIEHAHARGMRILELGSVPSKGAVSDKEYQIGYFKRGFATHIEDHWVWRWTPSLGSPDDPPDVKARRRED